MKTLKESVKERGIVLPLLAFNNEDGEPELISGHRRLWVARELRLETVPVIMKRVDRSEATLLMGITNSQYDALMRTMGRKDRAIGFAVFLDLLERLTEEAEKDA